jgi:hypothetical protein
VSPAPTRSKAQDKPSPADTEAGTATQDAEEYEPVLELDTLAPKRAVIRIRTEKDREGAVYELLHPDELGIEDEQILRSELREFSQLSGKDGKLTSAEKKRVLARLDELCRKVLFAPEAVRKALPPRAKQKVVTTFTGALFADDAAAVDQAMMARIVGSITES